MRQDSLFPAGQCHYNPRFTTSAMTRYAASYARGVALCPPLTRRASAPLARPDTMRKRPFASGCAAFPAAVKASPPDAGPLFTKRKTGQTCAPPRRLGQAGILIRSQACFFCGPEAAIRRGIPCPEPGNLEAIIAHYRKLPFPRRIASPLRPLRS